MRSRRAHFTRAQRLKSAGEFGRVFAGAERSADALFTVLGRPNAERVARLGLTVSKRTAKRAAVRNRLKRLARESFRQQRLPAWDFVVIARPKAALSDNRTLRSSLDRHFERLSERARQKSHG